MSNYKFPARSRKAMIEAILAQGGHDGYPIAFNVKMYNVDLDLATILKAVGTEYFPDFSSAEEETAYLELVQEKYDEHQFKLFDWALEDVQRSTLEADGYRMHWNKGEVIAELGLTGRSSGWLVITHFEGRSLVELSDYVGFTEGLEHLDFSELRSLYKYIEQCKVDFQAKNFEHEMEYQAGFTLLCNLVEPEWETRKEELADQAKIKAQNEKVLEALEAAKHIASKVIAVYLDEEEVFEDKNITYTGLALVRACIDKSITDLEETLK